MVMGVKNFKKSNHIDILNRTSNSGKGLFRTQGYWSIKRELIGKELCLIPRNEKGEGLAGFTEGDIKLISFAPEMHDLLWYILEDVIDIDNKLSLFTGDAIKIRDTVSDIAIAIIDILARIDVEEPCNISKDTVTHVKRRASEYNSEALHSEQRTAAVKEELKQLRRIKAHIKATIKSKTKKKRR